MCNGGCNRAWVVGAYCKGQRGGQELVICQASKTAKCNSLARLEFVFQVHILSEGDYFSFLAEM